MEFAASVLGVWSIWLLIRRNVWAFPIGIVMVLLYAIVFYQAKFYSDMVLQGIYVVMQAQGWYAWTRRKTNPDEAIVVRRLSGGQWGWIAAFVVCLTSATGYLMSRMTDASHIAFFSGTVVPQPALPRKLAVMGCRKHHLPVSIQCQRALYDYRIIRHFLGDGRVGV
jgi:nicotinamide mononucleotide transporter PnuC